MTTTVSTTVYPNAVLVDGVLTSLLVYAADGVTVIPQAGASVPYAPGNYYAKLVEVSTLVTESPFPDPGTPIDLVIPTISVVGGPGTAGQELVLIDADTAEFADPTGGGSTTGLLYADLAARPIVLADDQLVFYCTGRVANNDGGQGQFYADFGSVVTADSATVIAATGGRYIRIRNSDERQAAWYGATPGGTASANRTALLAAITASTGGARLSGSRSNTPVDIDANISLSADAQTGLHLSDMYIRKPSNGSSGGILELSYGGGAIPEGVSLENMRIEGNGTSDLVKAVKFAFQKHLHINNVRFGNQGKEGIYLDGGTSCEHAKVSHCHAENSGNDPVTPLAAYNLNIGKVFLHDSSSYMCGRSIEHTGDGGCIHDCYFEKAATAVTCVMGASTTFPNKVSTIHDLMIVDTDLAISHPTDHTRSNGFHMLHHCVLKDNRAGYTGGNKTSTNQPNMYDTFLMISAGGRYTSAAATGIFNIGGGNVHKGHLIACPQGTTTGQVASTSTITVPNTASGLHPIVEGSTLTHADIAGTVTVTAVSADNATLTFTPANGTVTGVSKTLSYKARPWALMVNSFYDDEPIFRDFTVLDIPWSGSCLRFVGMQWTVTGWICNPRGQSYGSLPFVQVLDIAGGATVEGSLDCSQLDITKPFTLSHMLPSVIHTATEPTTFAWKVGDVMEYPSPISGGTSRKKCTTAGSAGTLVGISGATTNGSPNITISGGTYAGKGVYVGGWYTHPNFAAPFRILSASGLTVVASANATATGSGAMAYSPPVWKIAETLA